MSTSPPRVSMSVSLSASLLALLLLPLCSTAAERLEPFSVEDLIRLLGVISNPLDDERLFGALACFANAVSPDALWLLRRAASDAEGRPRRVWPVIEWRYGSGEREPDDYQQD